MIVIEEGTEAFEYLRRTFTDVSGAYKVSLAVREDQAKVSIKVNEGMWTAPLSVKVVQ